MQSKSKSVQGGKTKPVEKPSTSLDDVINSLCLAGAITTEVVTILKDLRANGNKKERELAEKVFSMAAIRCNTRMAVNRLMGGM